MRVVLSVVIAIIAVPIWDWAAMGRIGLFASDCDYRYWPLSKSRIASVLVLFMAACIIGIVATSESNNSPIWALVVGAAALFVWAVVGFMDVLAQNRSGYRAPVPPPRYSDPNL